MDLLLEVNDGIEQRLDNRIAALAVFIRCHPHGLRKRQIRLWDIEPMLTVHFTRPVIYRANHVHGSILWTWTMDLAATGRETTNCATPRWQHDDMTGDSDVILDKLRLLNTEVKERLGRQSESSSKIDTKATTMLGFSVALGAFIASQAQLDWWRLVPLVFVVAACYFAWRAMDLRDYWDTPEPGTIFVEQFVLNRTELEALKLLINARVMDFDDNCKLHKAKAESWNRCIASLTLGAAGTLVLLLLIGAVSNA